MSAFPYSKLRAFLKEEKDQVEFMQVAAEAGIGDSDIELAKILLALQLYASIYARTPRDIKAVHRDAIEEIRRLRDEVALISDRASSDAVKIGQWAEEIHKNLQSVEPKEMAKLLHKKLLDDTVALLGGSLQALAMASGQIETTTQKMRVAAYQASTAIEYWEGVSMRRIWGTAFCFCTVAAFFILAGVWFFFLRHQPWWLSLQ